MKKLFAIFLAVLLTASVFAQSPEKMSYQAVIRNSSDVLVTNTQIGMQISILQGSADGSPVYVETQTPTTNANGLVSIEIGSGITSDDFSTINWASGPYYIKTETDPAGGTSYTISGTSQLMSVPYALHAKTAENGITTAQADAITTNTAKVGYTDALVSANTDVAANTAKVGITTAQATAISDNTAKTGITAQQASDITANNAKVGYTDALVSANTDVAANTAKVGITTAQADEIAANTLKTGITAQQASDITTNNAKVGITTAQTTKLAAIAEGAEVNVNADWDATSGDAQILNKPNIPAAADGSETKVTSGTNVTVTGSGTTASPYVVNATAGGSTLAIGDSYQGGIIFWLDATGQHGLIAATADQSIGIQWYNGTYRYTGTTGDGLYAGAMNTAMIVATQMADNQTGNFAAKVCADYSVTVSGVIYGDWYLPSKFELNILYAKKAAVGGFAITDYWSSTEDEKWDAWTRNFYRGYESFNFKEDSNRVRAVRAF